MRRLLTTLAVLVAVSCTTNTAFKENTNFTVAEPLIPISKIQYRDKISNSCISDVLVIDSLLLLQDECDSFYYHVYNLKYFQQIGKFGRKGEGPGEIAWTSFTGQYYSEADSTYFWTYDINNGKLYLINLKSSIETSQLKATHYPLDVNTIGAKEVVHLNSNLFFADYNREGAEFTSMIFNIILDTVQYISNPNEILKVPAHKIRALYNSKIARHPSDSKVVVAFEYFNRAFIYNQNGELSDSIIKQQEHIPDLRDPNILASNNTIRYNGDLSVDNDRIYLLNYELTIADYNDGRPSPTYLEVYDWQGNPLKKYKLDNRILAFSYSAESGYLVGVSDIYEYPLFIYQLL